MRSQSVSPQRRPPAEFIAWAVISGLLVLAIVLMLLSWS